MNLDNVRQIRPVLKELICRVERLQILTETLREVCADLKRDNEVIENIKDKEKQINILRVKLDKANKRINELKIDLCIYT